ncbi:MAG: hypothetical protein Q9216_000994 [Gyalolechia sp. 2 TL-2023]
MPPMAQLGPFGKRPPPAGYIRRFTGPPKSSTIHRQMQLSLDMADETSPLLGIFFAARFEHAFRDWRIYADKAIGRSGGSHVTIEAGARPKSDRQVGRLKEKRLLKPKCKYEKKSNTPKIKDTHEDDEPEITDPQPIPESSLHSTCNTPQSYDDKAELTIIAPVQELTRSVPEEAAEESVAKSAAKKTRKPRENRAAPKDQPKDNVVSQDRPVFTIPAGPKGHASFCQSGETSVSESENHPSQALNYDNTAGGFNAPLPLA